LGPHTREYPSLLSDEVEPINTILGKKVVKKTRDNDYIQYLIKWNDHPLEDTTWMTTSYISKYGSNIDKLMDKSSQRNLVFLGSLM
jgi:hypothetical protein